MNFSALKSWLALALFSGLISLAGCSGGKDKEEKDKDGKKESTEYEGKEEYAELQLLHRLYAAYAMEHRKGPAGVTDLEKADLDPGEKKAIAGLKAGKYVLIWNVNLQAVAEREEGTVGPAPSERTVLGYEKRVPTSGGHVVMESGDAKRVTPEKFKELPKAKGN